MLAELERFMSPPAPLPEQQRIWRAETDPRYRKLLEMEATCLALLMTPRLGAENATIEQIEERFGRVANEFTTQELREIQRERLASYPTLDLSFLKMQTTATYQGLEFPVPRFAVFSLGSPVCCAYYRSYPPRRPADIRFSFSTTRNEYHGYLDQEIEKYLQPTLLKSFQSLPMFHWLTVRFQGLIPPAAYRAICQAVFMWYEYNPSRCDLIYLIREVQAEEWTVTEPPPGLVDPLIVGVFDKKCYLFGSFNVTPGESWAASEFRTSP